MTRAALSLVLLAGGLVAVTGTAPANADSPFTRVRAQSGPGSEDTKSATASCPAGKTVVGAGGHLISDAYGTVILTAVLPRSDGVTARAAAVPGQPAGSWSVVAVAVCAPVISTAVAGGSGPVKPTITTGSFTANCGGTDIVSGTGFALPGMPGQALLTTLMPSADLRSVTATATLRPPGLYAPTAYAVCVPPDRGYTVRSASVPKDTTAPKTVTATGESFGVGASVDGDVDDVFLDGMVPDPGLRSATAHASKLAGGTDPDPWGLTVVGPDAFSTY